MKSALKSLVLHVLRFFRDAGVSRESRLLVGFSGGVDSTALVLALQELGCTQVLAHVDHGLRPESAQDVRHVAAFAEHHGLPLVSRRLDVAGLAQQEHIGLEDAGRRARYAFLETVRLRQHCRWMVLGHQADDLVEDVLLRLVRGTGWPGLGGMRAVDAKRHLLRPLLHVPRNELDDVLHEAGIRPVEDESNESMDFRRNRLRHGVVPLLQAENPALCRSVIRLHDLAGLDADYWQRMLAPTIEFIGTNPESKAVSLDEKHLRALHPAERLRIYAHMLCRVQDEGQARAETLFALEAAFVEAQRPKVFQFPGGARGVLGGGCLTFSGGIERGETV